MPASTRSSAAADGSGSVWVTVLAGGIGSRFWPASTPRRPKQLLALGTERPLIVDTVERARALVSDDRVRILASQGLADAFASVLPELPESAYWIEPQARGTAPVLAWAAWRIAQEDPDAVMVSLHADHLIQPVEAFAETVAAAIAVARDHEALVCIGAKPSRVETGFGHIELGERIKHAEFDAFRVAQFHEKPDAETARRYIEAGQLWNTGIFVWRTRTLLDEVDQHAPELGDALRASASDADTFFSSAPVGVIDEEVMERSGRVATVKASFDWDDVGSWDALARTHHPDGSGNVTIGPVELVESTDSIVFAEEGTVTLLGVEGLVVVRSGEHTLVVPRERVGDLKELLAKRGGSA